MANPLPPTPNIEQEPVVSQSANVLNHKTDFPTDIPHFIDAIQGTRARPADVPMSMLQGLAGPTERMQKRAGIAEVRTKRSAIKHQYWAFADLVEASPTIETALGVIDYFEAWVGEQPGPTADEWSNKWSRLKEANESLHPSKIISAVRRLATGRPPTERTQIIDNFRQALDPHEGDKSGFRAYIAKRAQLYSRMSTDRAAKGGMGHLQNVDFCTELYPESALVREGYVTKTGDRIEFSSRESIEDFVEEMQDISADATPKETEVIDHNALLLVLDTLALIADNGGEVAAKLQAAILGKANQHHTRARRIYEGVYLKDVIGASNIMTTSMNQMGEFSSPLNKLPLDRVDMLPEAIVRLVYASLFLDKTVVASAEELYANLSINDRIEALIDYVEFTQKRQPQKQIGNTAIKGARGEIVQKNVSGRYIPLARMAKAGHGILS